MVPKDTHTTLAEHTLQLYAPIQHQPLGLPPPEPAQGWAGGKEIAQKKREEEGLPLPVPSLPLPFPATQVSWGRVAEGGSILFVEEVLCSRHIQVL